MAFYVRFHGNRLPSAIVNIAIRFNSDQRISFSIGTDMKIGFTTVHEECVRNPDLLNKLRSDNKLFDHISRVER